MSLLLMMSLVIPGITCFCYTFNISKLLILISSDVEQNPGPGPNHIRGLNIMYSNINSIGADKNSRFGELEILIANKDIDIIALNEVGNIKKENYELDNYTIVFYSSENRGNIVYYHNSIYCEMRNDLCDGTDSYAWLQVKTGHASILLGVYYRSPSQTPDERRTFFQNFKDIITKINNQSDQPIMVVGDFNSKHEDWCLTNETTTPGRELKRLLEDLSLEQIIREPTRIKANVSSCLDITITDSPGLILDHSAVKPNPYLSTSHN